MTDSSQADPLADVVLAISTFRADETVIALLRELFARGNAGFGHVIIVDSLGSGAIEAEIAEKGWPVSYHNADRNLGSAGNLSLRLQMAAETNASWCYAINHDGMIDPDQVRKLLAHGTARERVGAVYPQIVYSEKGYAAEAPRRTLAPHSRALAAETPAGCVEVAWSSSNCALYNLQPLREGARVWAELWMCWEDLGYGWELGARGWTQLLCTEVSVIDSLEYRRLRLLGRELYLADKPIWYSYYLLRNLLLIRRRSRGQALTMIDIVKRGAASMLISALQDHPFKRLRLMARGAVDGAFGRTGKGKVP